MSVLVRIKTVWHSNSVSDFFYYLKIMKNYPACMQIVNDLVYPLRLMQYIIIIVDRLLIFYRQLGDNCIQNFHFGRYFVGYTVGNLVLQRRAFLKGVFCLQHFLVSKLMIL